MFLTTVSTELLLLCAALAALIGLLGYLLLLLSKRRRLKRRIDAMSAALVDYFRRTGVEVSVTCADLEGNNRFTAFIESEPMKRFRLSHIIEMTIREHVEKTCGLELDKVYWRFPIKDVTQAVVMPSAPAVDVATNTEDPDDYINQGLVNYRDLPKFEVTEISWEKFEEAASRTDGNSSESPEPERTSRASEPQKRD
jgi:hypothetical protein